MRDCWFLGCRARPGTSRPSGLLPRLTGRVVKGVGGPGATVADGPTGRVSGPDPQKYVVLPRECTSPGRGCPDRVCPAVAELARPVRSVTDDRPSRRRTVSRTA